ncbi:MAG TPA: SIS domain-containing protein [Mycobacterium sp.]|nr:SIS domain-containing protein [Mycobacterium sp.]
MNERSNTARSFELAAALPEHLALGADAARTLSRLPQASAIDNIVILGMGTGRTAGLVIRALTIATIAVPILVESSYELPGCIGRRSLVIALSGSGNTDEVNHAAAAAAERGARLVVVTAGGWLADFAGDHGGAMISIPPEIQPARATLGVMVGGLMSILEQIGLLPEATRWINSARTQLCRRRQELHNPGNVAACLAESLVEQHIICQGDTPIGGVAAGRWKAQLNQTARQPASISLQPDASHNEVVAWDFYNPLMGEAVILLRHPYENQRVSRLMDLWTQYLGGKIPVHTVRGAGETRCAALLDLIMIGDFTALHIAAARGIDPNDVAYISQTVKHGIGPPQRTHAGDD